MKHFAITIFSIATIAAISWINVSEAQDVQITNTPAEPVPVFPVTPPADQYFAIGPTSNSTDGNAGGVGGLNALCKTAYANDFPLARACTTVEASNTPNLTAITPIGAWVRPVIANELMVRDPKEKVWIASRTDETGLSLSQVNGDYNFISPRNTMDCRGWSMADLTYRGAVAVNGRLGMYPCDEPLPVLCCSPLPLPAYQDTQGPR